MQTLHDTEQSADSGNIYSCEIKQSRRKNEMQIAEHESLNAAESFASLLCLNTLNGCFTAQFIMSETKSNITGKSHTTKMTNTVFKGRFRFSTFCRV